MEEWNICAERSWRDRLRGQSGGNDGGSTDIDDEKFPEDGYVLRRGARNTRVKDRQGSARNSAAHAAGHEKDALCEALSRC